MNLALERYAGYPVIDELVCWPPRSQRIESFRACCVLFRKPFIEVEMEGSEIFQRHFARESFGRHWAEACVIPKTITRIRLISDFDFEPLEDVDRLAQDVIANRDECIAESNLMFEEGMYEPFLTQYGEDCGNLSLEVVQKIARAKRHLEQAG